MMRIPFLNLQAINDEIMPEIDEASQRALRSGWYILGKENEAFEAKLKESLIGPKQGYALGCNSGTDAIVLALLAGAVGAGAEVITVSLTAIPTVSAICETGAIPVFVDIDPNTWVMDVTKVAELLTPKTRAVVAVHLYGNMVDVFALKAVLKQAAREDVLIIEDVAQAQGAALRGEQAGTLGDFGTFSFYPSKNIGALGDGGAVFCKDELFYQRLKMLRNYGQESRYCATLRHGRNSRLDEAQAAILSVKLNYLNQWLGKKNEQMRRYKQGLASSSIQFQVPTAECEPGWHLCVAAQATNHDRDSFMAFLKSNDIETLIHYPIPNHQQAAFRHFADKSLPVTEDLAGRIVSLPLNTVLSKAEQEFIVEIINQFTDR